MGDQVASDSAEPSDVTRDIGRSDTPEDFRETADEQAPDLPAFDRDPDDEPNALEEVTEQDSQSDESAHGDRSEIDVVDDSTPEDAAADEVEPDLGDDTVGDAAPEDAMDGGAELDESGEGLVDDRGTDPDDDDAVDLPEDDRASEDPIEDTTGVECLGARRV